MEWPRVKNILIVLLAIVNVFLLIAYSTSALRETRAVESMARDTYEALSGLGVKIDPEIIPRRANSLFPARGVWTPEDDARGFAELLGGDTKNEENGVISYSGKNGTATVSSDGTFTADIKSNERDADAMCAAVVRCATALGIELTADPVMKYSENSRSADALQSILGVPVYNCRITAVPGDDGVINVSGKRTPRKLTIMRGKPPRDVGGLMINLVEELRSEGKSCTVINELEVGYRAGNT
ncbi:MAG: hypothetical protein RSC43_01970, partial [Clostridia bacterium]